MDGCVSRCLKLPKLQRAGRCRNEIRLRLQVLESGGPKTAPKQLQWWSRKKKTWKKTSCPQKRNQNYICVVIHEPHAQGKTARTCKESLLKRSLCSTNIAHITATIEEITRPTTTAPVTTKSDGNSQTHSQKARKGKKNMHHTDTHTHSHSYPLSFLTWTSLGDPWSHHTCKNTVIRALPLFILVSHANSQAPRLLPLTSANYSCCYLYSYLWIDLMIWRLTINIRP